MYTDTLPAIRSGCTCLMRQLTYATPPQARDRRSKSIEHSDLMNTQATRRISFLRAVGGPPFFIDVPNSLHAKRANPGYEYLVEDAEKVSELLPYKGKGRLGSFQVSTSYRRASLAIFDKQQQRLYFSYNPLLCGAKPRSWPPT